MWTFLTGLVILGVGGCLYGSFVERFFGISDRPTPATTKADGVDFVPMSSWRNGLIHLLNIAGTGPILGPIQGILFGPLAFITIPLGCILAGAVQDYMVGMISIRNDGEQIQSLVKRFLGKHVAFYFGIFVLLAVLLFGVTCVYTPGDIFVKGVLKQSTAMSNPWLWVIYGVIFTYYLIATLLPIDKIIGRVYPYIGGFFIFTALLLFLYIFLKRLPLEELSLANWRGLKPNFFPIFFVTVACGIASGFHSTQSTIISRTLTHEREGRKIFYNMMLVEGFIAMIWAAVTMGVIKLYGIDTAGGATNMLAEIIDDVLKVFDIDNSSPHDDLVYVVGKLFANGIDIIVILGVIVLPITSGDTALRGCRLMAGEMLGVDQSKPKNRLLLGAAIFALTAVLLIIAKFSNSGFQLLWRYFAWANQTIVVFSLAMATAWCIKEGKSIWVTVLPGAFYLAVTSSFILNASIGFNLHWLVADIIATVLALAYIIYFVNLNFPLMKAKEKVLCFLEKHGAAIVFTAAALLFLALRFKLFFKYGLSQDEVLIISQVRTWDPVKIWHYYGFGGQGFFLQHYIFYVLSLGGVFASVTFLRFICLVESFLGFFLLYKFTKKYFGALVCFGALLVYALSPYQIIYTLYIRFYALVMTLVIAECYFYFEALEKEDWKKLWLPALFAALAYCTHQFSVFIQPVFLVHFLIFCLARRPNKANAKWFIWGALTLAFIACLAFCAPALAKKTGLIFGAKDAWLPVKLGLASQRLQFFFWNDALPLRVCSLVFLWLSLGLAITARIAKREKILPVIFLVLGIVIPYFFLSHFHFAHFFDRRYLAFWFPIWTVAWVVWLEFPAYVLGNLRVLEGKTVLRNVSAGVFFLVFLISFFRFSSLFKMRWIESGNREAVTFLEERAAKKDLPLILISEPDAGSRNNILPQYYFDVLDHKGGAYLDLLTVMRKGAAYEKMDESAVVWSQTAKRLKKPEAFERSQIGSHELIYGGTFTNWHDVAAATAKVIPESAKLMPSGPLYYEGVLDVGSKEADTHLLSGFSHDEFVSPEENWTWCVGTNITARFMFMGCSNYCVAARVRAIEKMRADFFLDGQPVGSATIGTAFTNVLFRANVIPKPRPNGAPLLLNVVTSGTKVPGQVAKGVYDNRPLSLCFDKLTVCPAPDEEDPAAAIGLADHRPKARKAKAGEPFEITVLCANLGKTTWECQGNNPFRLSLSWQNFDHKEIQDDRIWLTRDVPPGDTIRVKCSVKAPERSCNVLLLDMVHENVRFFRQCLPLAVQIEIDPRR